MASPYILAVLKPKEGKLEEITAGMKELAAAVEKEEPGCLSYSLFTNKDGHVIVIEQYKDMAAIQAHQTAPHMVEARKQAGDDLEEPPQIFILNEVGGFKR